MPAPIAPSKAECLEFLTSEFKRWRSSNVRVVDCDPMNGVAYVRAEWTDFAGKEKAGNFKLFRFNGAIAYQY